jgi:DNA helicase-2/ATP-dependent DNA helicase PcrA
MQLSKEQKQIVEYENKPILVKASAGSGKTRVLTERIKYLLPQTNKQVLALTFTNKAAEEIKERLSLEEKKRVFTGTFHSFVQTILENHGHLIGYSKQTQIFENEKDRLKIIEEAIEKIPNIYDKFITWERKKKNNYLQDILNFISIVKRELLTPNELYEKIKSNEIDEIVELYQTYQDILTIQKAIDFDDLIFLAYRLFTDYPKVAKLYRKNFFAILIDEAQDLNNAQYNFLLSFTNSEFKNVMLVGDPNQSIFHFVGSDSKIMTEIFVEDFKPKIFELKKNYRSAKKILEKANQIINQQIDLSNIAIEGYFECYKAYNEKDETKWVVNKIKELIKMKSHKDIEGEINYEKIAILARHKYLFIEIENLLKEEKIPYYYKMNVYKVNFESKVMKIFDLALRVKINKYDILHYQQLLNLLNIKNKINIKNKKITFDNLINEINDPLTKRILQIVFDLREDGSNIRKLFNDFLKELSNKNEEYSFIKHDIKELLTLWSNYAKNNDKKSLNQFKNQISIGKIYSQKELKGITLSTIHTMKGQEYDIVFIIGVDDETIPYYKSLNNNKELEQEKNNLYVAFTRAKRFLYISYPENRMMPWGDISKRKISRFLKNII